MASNKIYECKICGSDLVPIPGVNLGRCDSCGTTQPVPQVTDDQKILLYNRANQYRRAHDYKLAITEFENIIKEDPNDPDVYWNIVLCKHEIEYVQDPNTYKMVPTCNRIVSSSILDDPDYHKALELSDVTSRSMYENEARQIDQIERQTKEIYSSEKPYDVFICYKEKNLKGGRTEDSVIAEHIYDALKSDYRVFFSMISLSDKLGAEYEPFIYHALQTAKVMILVATNKEYVESVWLENEWSRYLKVIEQNHSKKLVIAYKDMNPGELPYQLAHMQGQDIGRIGGMEDLIRGIRSIVGEKKVQASFTAAAAAGILPADNLCANGQTNLRLGELDAARKCFEDMTKYYPDDWRGWWGMVLINTSGLRDPNAYFDDPDPIQNAFRNAKMTAPDVQFKEPQDKFTAYLEKVAELDYQAEMELVDSRVRDIQNNIKTLQRDSENINQQVKDLYEDRKTNKSKTRPDLGIDSHIAQLKSGRKSGGKYMVYSVIGILAGLLVMLFLRTGVIPEKIAVYTVLIMFLIVCVVIGGMIGGIWGVGIGFVLWYVIGKRIPEKVLPLIVLGLIAIFVIYCLSKLIGNAKERGTKKKAIRQWESRRAEEKAAIDTWYKSYDTKVEELRQKIRANYQKIQANEKKIGELQAYAERHDEITEFFHQVECQNAQIDMLTNEVFAGQRSEVLDL
ncbi:MAG: TIR domain-containing protein [Eubacterium sp.]|nr:TIR domain-containing protein [Eubacterium sp.]